MSRDPRAEELSNLRFALATFALHLDAFEARLKDRQRASNTGSRKFLPDDAQFANRIVRPKGSLPTPPKTAS